MKNVRHSSLISLCLIIALLLVILSGCSAETTKTALNAETVAEKLEQAGFQISDVTDSFGEGFSTALAAETDVLHVEFYEMDTVADAQGFQQNVLSSLKSESSASSYSNTEGENYLVSKLSAGGNYYVVTQIENTVLIVAADSGQKDAVKNFAESLGYI